MYPRLAPNEQLKNSFWLEYASTKILYFSIKAFSITSLASLFLALDNFQKIVSLVEESGYEFTDPYSEFYYSYIQFMKGNESEAKKWLHLAEKHGSVRARLVLNNVPYREVAEDEDYDC